MKVFRKMFAFAVTVAAIAMATSAFAATAVYDDTDTDNPLVKITDGEFAENAQMTVAVLPVGFGSSDDDADIMYIDQDAAEIIKEKLASGLAVKGELVNPADNYEVRVAGTNTAMQTINFEAVQEEEDYEYITGEGALGIKGSFNYDGTAKTVVLTLKDAKNGDKEGSIEWDLLGGIAATNAKIRFGLEIQSTTRDLSGITVVSISDAQ